MEDHVVDTADFRLILEDGLTYPAYGISVYSGSQKFIHGLQQHFNAGFDDETGDNNTEPGFQVDVEEQGDDCGYQNGEGNDRIEGSVRSGGYQRSGIQLFSGLLDIGSEKDLYHNGDGDDREGKEGVIRLFRSDDLFDRLDQGCEACVEDKGGDDCRAEIFRSSVSEGMLLIRFFGCVFGPQDGDDGGKRVRQIVHCVQDDRDGIGRQSYDCFKSGEEHIRSDAD